MENNFEHVQLKEYLVGKYVFLNFKLLKIVLFSTCFIFLKRRVLRGGVREKCEAIGFYNKVKIHSVHTCTPKRIYTKKTLRKSFEFFREDIGTFILKELKKAGDGFSSKNFMISNDMANFLKNKYNLKTNWVDGSEFLASLKIPLKIRTALDTLPVMIQHCEIKFGYNRCLKYFSGEDVRDRNSKWKSKEDKQNINYKLLFILFKAKFLMPRQF